MGEYVGFDGLAISGFRSFSSTPQYLRDLTKVNILIGKNNSGKSNVLRFIAALPKLNEGSCPFKTMDYHTRKGTRLTQIRVLFQLVPGSPRTGKLFSELEKAAPQIRQAVSAWSLPIWVPYLADRHLPLDEAEACIWVDKLEEALGWDGVLTIATSLGADAARRDDTRIHLTRQLFAKHPCIRPVHFIRSVRQATADTEYAFIGTGLIRKLRELKSPKTDQDENRVKFSKIQEFVRDVLGEAKAELDVVHTGDQITVEMNGRRLELSSLGAGIEQVIVLAAAATSIENSIVCIEEPETNLHPELQVKLINYIISSTNNQYFITTHSNAVFDCADVSIYHCSLIDDATQCKRVNSDVQKGSVLDDLGYKASQILQANCIIWVEGPSDRILLRKWIQSKDPDLFEGLHFSIMFYGGRLLAHLTASDPEVGDFIRLLKINRHSAIVIDSDRSSRSHKVSETKERVASEAKVSWITAGREIENYIPSETLSGAIRSVHGCDVTLAPPGEYTRLTRYQGEDGEWRSIDKVKVAREVVKSDADLNVLDLDDRISGLVQFIRAANHLK